MTSARDLVPTAVIHHGLFSTSRLKWAHEIATGKRQLMELSDVCSFQRALEIYGNSESYSEREAAALVRAIELAFTKEELEQIQDEVAGFTFFETLLKKHKKQLH